LGTKLKTQEYTGTTLTRTSDYLGSVQYLNGVAQFAATAEGRVYNNSGSYRYDYFMKDQVGNIRLTYTANGTGVTVLQRDEYYPFGNTFDSYLGSGGANAYKFNGMEFQENGLNTFDFHARMYDPQIGRSFQPDPHADSYAAKSPFSFLANNPINYTDPTGMDEEEWDDEGGGGGNGEYGWFLTGGGYTGVSTGNKSGYIERNDIRYDYVRGTYTLGGRPISNEKAMAIINRSATIGKMNYVWRMNETGELARAGSTLENSYRNFEIVDTGIPAAQGNGGMSYMDMAHVISIGLLADDASGVGVIDDVLIPVVYAVAFVLDHPPTMNMSRFKPGFQGGKQNKRDKGTSGYPTDFKRWLHQQKDPKEPDFEPFEIKEWYKEWLIQGSPKPR
jgi:RHS repeat-associated protein